MLEIRLRMQHAIFGELRARHHDPAYSPSLKRFCGQGD